MNNVSRLLKLDLINALSISANKKSKKAKAKKKSTLVSTILFNAFFILFIAFYVVMFCIMAHFCEPIGSKDYCMVYYGVGMGGMLSLLMTFGKAHAVLFKTKDFEFLSSLPIKTTSIVTSKILSLFIVNYMFFLSAYIPAMICYLCFASSVTVVNVISMIIIMILGPAFSTVICSGLSYLVGELLSKSKYKNILSSITSVIFLIIFMIGIFYLEFSGMNLEDSEYLLAMNTNLSNVFSKAYFLSIFARYAITDANILNSLLNLLYFVLISIVPLIVFIYFISKNFVKINSRGNAGYKNKDFKLEQEFQKEKHRSQVLALLKKEAKTFFTTSIYLQNVIISPIMSVIAIVIMKFAPMGIGDMPINRIAFIIAIAGSVTMGLATSTSSAISMEGKQFWIIKTSPIKTENVLFAKCLLYILLCAPFIIIGPILASILFKLGIINCILIMICEFITVCMFSMFDLWVNTTMPKFDWTNAAQVVKSGTCTLIAMLFSFAIQTVLIVPCVILMVFTEINPLLMFLFIVLNLATGSYFLLFKAGKRNFEKIEL